MSASDFYLNKEQGRKKDGTNDSQDSNLTCHSPLQKMISKESIDDDNKDKNQNYCDAIQSGGEDVVSQGNNIQGDATNVIVKAVAYSNSNHEKAVMDTRKYCPFKVL